MITAVERAREILASAPLRGLACREIHPGSDIVIPRGPRQDHPARGLSTPTTRPATARIGTESSGVVDPQLRVHGVQQLRVADAWCSRHPHGNTHAPTVMAGEKAAIMIAAAD